MKLKKLNLLILAAATVLAGHAHAATIIYSTKAATVNSSIVGGKSGGALNTGLFNTSGTFVRAVNLGTTSTVSFDGISFAGTIPSQITLLNLGSSYPDFHGGTGTGNLSTTGRHGTSGSATVTLSSLTIGQAYRFQALVYDGRAGKMVERFVSTESTGAPLQMAQQAPGNLVCLSSVNLLLMLRRRLSPLSLSAVLVVWEGN